MVSAKDFVVVWQSAENLDEVVTRTGLTKAQASTRAVSYRRKGVDLKRFTNRTALDVAALSELAKGAAEGTVGQ